MKRERKRKGSECLIVWIAAAVMTAGGNEFFDQ